MPEMMAIGDSLFNGVRSLTINQPMAQWSAPAQVAKALGISFALPDYPRNVVINLEQWVQLFPYVGDILGDLAQNIAFWSFWRSASSAEFDNIAIASTTYRDMLDRTWRTAEQELANLPPALGANLGNVGNHLADLFFAFNTRFLLNPSRDAARAAESPMQIVARRKPKRLLVSIGANNGLWRMGFEAEAGTAMGNPGPFASADVQDLKAFVAALRGLPPQIKHIYVNTLPLPRGVANLMPLPDTSNTQKPGAGGYYPVYENVFGGRYRTLTDAQLRTNDGIVRAVNTLVATEAAADPRIHIVPIDQTFETYDFKANPYAMIVQTSDGKMLSNLVLEGPEGPFPNQWRGGLMGMDGMHPSIVGYAVMAQTILDAIETHEGIPAKKLDLGAAYRADTLLWRLPANWNMFRRLTRDLRKAQANGQPLPTTLAHLPAAEILSAIQFKID